MQQSFIFVLFMLFLLNTNSVAQGGSYKKCMKEGYVNFEEGRYEEAKDHFQKALSYKPEAKEPKEEIAKCDAAISKSEIENQFQKLWATAMGYFDQKDYQNALTHFKRCAAIKPADVQTKEMIEQCKKQIELESNPTE